MRDHERRVWERVIQEGELGGVKKRASTRALTYKQRKEKPTPDCGHRSNTRIWWLITANMSSATHVRYHTFVVQHIYVRLAAAANQRTILQYQ